MSSHTKFEITFWGVRGSVPTPAEHTVKYGGNTPCLEIRAGDNLLLIDAGTGICRFAARLAQLQNENLNILELNTNTKENNIEQTYSELQKEIKNWPAR